MEKLMKQTEERHSESRMHEICPSGLMRGSPRAVIGLVPLIPTEPPYSTALDLLLTCATISDARDMTKARLGEK